MATLTDLFAGRNITKAVQGIKPGLPIRVPQQFFAPTDPMVPGHTFEWLEIDGNRDMALVVGQDSPSVHVGHPNAKRKSATMLRSFEHQSVNANKLRNLVGPDGQTRDAMGKNLVRESSLWFKQRQKNLLQTCIQRMLFKFTLYFNEKGQLLTSSSGAVTAIDVGIPAGQLNQLDILGDGAIIDASWATATTNIPGHLEEIRNQMLQLGNWMVVEAFYGKNISKYVAANNYAKEFINRNANLNAQMFQNANRVPTGFMEYNWHYAGDAFYIDADGAVQKLLGDDEIVFTPTPADTSWWKLAYGSEMVPRGVLRAGQSIEDLLNDLVEVFGEFAYAEVNLNPVSVKQHSGINFLPVISATKAVCKADVTP